MFKSTENFYIALDLPKYCYLTYIIITIELLSFMWNPEMVA